MFGLIIAAAVAGNAAIAYRLRPRLGTANPSSALLDRYREILESRFAWVTLGVAALVGLFAGGTASGQVFDYLAWRNATPFNVNDPQFGLDVSFFVFGYPWWRFVLSFVFATLVVSVIVAAVVHYTMGGLRLSGVRRGASRAAAAHLSILIGLAVLVRGIGYWFDQYGLEISRTNRLFTGISYTADNATVTAKLILAIIAGICGLLFFANAVLQRWAVPVIGVVLLLLSAIVLGLVYPGAVQYFTVRPNEPDRERDYITRNINATRAAYGVENVEITNYSAETTASAGQLSEDAEALPGIRLIDPNVVGPAFEQLQQVRGFYSFPRTLDVDRYTIEGQETDAVVAVREMDLRGLESANWNNLKTVYTHGYGLVAAYGNRRQPSGEPEWIVRDIPPVGPLAEYEPRIYFGELQGVRSDEFSIVGAPAGSPAIELDTPGGGEAGNPKTTTYTGKGGVPVGNLWSRILYAAKFADVNILLSDRVNSESKIIYDRTPRERVQAAAPWLKVDGDAYPAVVEGRIVWIVDGYTTSNSYPNSERVNLGLVTPDAQTSVGGTVVAQPQDDINYMRNSVKAVVDAYDGTVRLFAWDPDDPVLQTWQKAFPGVVENRRRDPGGPAGPPALPAGPVQGAAADPDQLPRHRPGHLVLQLEPVGGAERPGPGVVPGQGAAVLPFGEVAGGPGTDLLADHLVRAPRPAEPRGVHGGQRRRQQQRVRPDAHPHHVRHLPDRRSGAELQRDDHQRDGGRSAAAVPQPGGRDGDVRQPAHAAIGGRTALRDAGLHPAAGEHGVLPGAPLRDRAVRAVRGHRRHPETGAGPGVPGQLRCPTRGRTAVNRGATDHRRTGQPGGDPRADRGRSGVRGRRQSAHRGQPDHLPVRDQEGSGRRRARPDRSGPLSARLVSVGPRHSNEPTLTGQKSNMSPRNDFLRRF